MRAVLILALSATMAHGQACGMYEDYARQAAEDHGESRRYAGLTDTGVIIEFWADSEDGSWTIFAVNADGIACVRATGNYWEEIEPAALGIDG